MALEGGSSGIASTSIGACWGGVGLAGTWGHPHCVPMGQASPDTFTHLLGLAGSVPTSSTCSRAGQCSPACCPGLHQLLPGAVLRMPGPTAQTRAPRGILHPAWAGCMLPREEGSQKQGPHSYSSQFLSTALSGALQTPCHSTALPKKPW